MRLVIGSRLGSYEILASIGAGGMGEVYRARDTGLGRDVAIKILPQAFTTDLNRLARFEREARVLASLNHPHIASIYGVERTDGVQGLVLELVEGETLADRLRRGPLPVSDALTSARQIADALDAAHEKGIVHRDLKLANIKVTPEGVVKVLDFGLAKVAGQTAENHISNVPTLTLDGTKAGAILGTAAYMSPEQARGQAVDKRTDLWAFGCVLYEMLSGRRAFVGDDVSETLAFVLTTEPDWTRLPTETPAAIRTLLRRCLHKDRTQRLDSATVARLEMEDARSMPISDVASAPVLILPRRIRERLAWIVSGLFAIVAVTAWWAPWRATKPEERPLMRYSIDLGPEAVADPNLTVVVSPDGQHLVFPVRGPNGTTLLATRALDQRTLTVLRGTDGATAAFFSPDGQQVGFWDDAGFKLKKVSLAGGPPVILCETPNFGGASWGTDGFIIAAMNNGLYRVPEDGGLPQALTRPDRGVQAWPQILPGGRGVVFTTVTAGGNFESADTIELLRLDTGRTTTLISGGYFGRYLSAASGAGHLLYLREGTLYAAAFDPTDARLRGQALPVLDDVAGQAVGSAKFAVSQSGAVYYQSGAVANDPYPVLWLNRAGKTTPLLAKAGTYQSPRFSPDGARLAITVESEGRSDVSVYDWQRDRLSRLDSSGRATDYPVWAPDGTHLVVRSQSSPSGADGSALVWMHADSGESTPLVSSKREIFPFSFSPDGTRLAYMEHSAETQMDIWILPLDISDPTQPKPGRPEAFLRTPANEGSPMFSPDGRWLAYSSNESGRYALYVRPVGGDSARTGAKWQIWKAGASPIWSRDGRQITFLAVPQLSVPSPGSELDRRLMTVDLAVRDGALVVGTPRVFADVPLRNAGFFSGFDLHPDGQRAAVFPGKAVGSEPRPRGSVHVNVLLNFSDELRRRVPIGKP